MARARESRRAGVGGLRAAVSRCRNATNKGVESLAMAGECVRAACFVSPSLEAESKKQVCLADMSSINVATPSHIECVCFTFLVARVRVRSASARTPCTRTFAGTLDCNAHSPLSAGVQPLLSCAAARAPCSDRTRVSLAASPPAARRGAKPSGGLDIALEHGCSSLSAAHTHTRQ